MTRISIVLWGLCASLVACEVAGPEVSTVPPAEATSEASEAERAAEPEPAKERPEGWASLEGEGSASRLYYQFVDARGSVRFVERIEDVPEAWRANVGFVKMDVAPPLSPVAASALRRERTQGARRDIAANYPAPSEIRLYSADWCGACQRAKKYLSRNRVPFKELNIDIPAVGNALVQKTGSRTIPVLDVDGRVITGYSPSQYDRLLSDT